MPQQMLHACSPRIWPLFLECLNETGSDQRTILLQYALERVVPQLAVDVGHVPVSVWYSEPVVQTFRQIPVRIDEAKKPLPYPASCQARLANSEVFPVPVCPIAYV